MTLLEEVDRYIVTVLPALLITPSMSKPGCAPWFLYIHSTVKVQFG